jgi:putative two-component system response regulator
MPTPPWDAPNPLDTNEIEGYIKALLGPETNYQLFLDTIIAFGKIVDQKSRYTYEHSQRVVRYAAQIVLAKNYRGHFGNNFQEFQKMMGAVIVAGFLHDIGKIYVYDWILDEERELSKYELATFVRPHAEEGAEIIKIIESIPQEVIDGIRYHHERFDGNGYYNIEKWRLGDVPRILCLADAFDAMTSPRPYRPTPLEHPEVFQEICERGQNQFYPEIINIYCEIDEVLFTMSRNLQPIIPSPSPASRCEPCPLRTTVPPLRTQEKNEYST